MSSSQDHSGLLETLKQLYSRVVVLHAESRARKSLKNNTSSSLKIEAPFSECIDKLADRHSVSTSSPHTPDSRKRTSKRSTINRDPSSRNDLGELSKHLKESNRYSGASMDTGDRLVHSTWEHFHAAIRHARQGNTDEARLHMRLTTSAYNEAAHYLPDSAYSRFSNEILHALEKINIEIDI